MACRRTMYIIIYIHVCIVVQECRECYSYIHVIILMLSTYMTGTRSIHVHECRKQGMYITHSAETMELLWTLIYK